MSIFTVYQEVRRLRCDICGADFGPTDRGTDASMKAAVTVKVGFKTFGFCIDDKDERHACRTCAAAAIGALNSIFFKAQKQIVNKVSP